MSARNLEMEILRVLKKYNKSLPSVSLQILTGSNKILMYRTLRRMNKHGLIAKKSKVKTSYWGLG